MAKTKFKGLKAEIKEKLHQGYSRNDLYRLADEFRKKYGVNTDSFKRMVRKIDNSMDLKPAVQTLDDLNQYRAYNNDDLVAAVVDAMKILKVNTQPKPLLKSKNNRVAILQVTDTHLLAKIQFGGELSKLNNYNIDIAFKRTDFVFDEFMQFLQLNQITNAIIYLSGDIYEGLIHEEGRNWEDSIMDVAIEYCVKLTSRIQEVAQIANVKVINVSGNHSRLSKKFEFKMFARNNFDYLTGKIIKLMNPNLEVEVCTEFFMREEINGTGFLLTHGNMFKGGKSMIGNPGSSISRDVTMLVSKIYKDIGITNIKYMIVGHFHTHFNIAGMAVRVLGGGSMVGHNDFSVGNSFGSPASQNIYVVDDNGRVDIIKEIFCGHIME